MEPNIIALTIAPRSCKLQKAKVTTKSGALEMASDGQPQFLDGM
jgi:hypothetical protein